MNAEPAEHRHLLFCSLGKGRDSLFFKSLKLLSPCRLYSRFTFAPRLFFILHELQHIRRFVIQQENANRRYNIAIEAQKQKECHPFNLPD